jgi:NAD(P)-dependent dehydrogenase (short-subunit alcohol dehydrogenase family)
LTRVILVTGATDGIGRETARQLAEQGWHVLVHGRTEANARNAVISNFETDASTTPVWANFEAMDEVADLATQVSRLTPTVDALINDAGMYAKKRKLTADGFESTMAVNHFAPFLLTLSLLPQLVAAENVRVVTVSSMTHSGASLNLSDLSFAHRWNSYDAYSSSKLADILFIRSLAIELKNTRVTANALHPGVVDTKLLSEAFAMSGTSIRDCARTSLYLTTSAKVASITGKYFVDCLEQSSSATSRDAHLAAALWAISRHSLATYL